MSTDLSLPPSGFRPSKILEIGDRFLFHDHLPDITDRVYSGRPPNNNDEGSRFTLKLAWSLYHKLKAKEYDLIVVTPLSIRLWRPTRGLIQNCIGLIKKLLYNFDFFGVYFVLLLKAKETPAIVIDLFDTMLITPQNFWMFPRIDLYFKRELPQNNWNVFLYTSPKNEDVSNIRRQKEFQEAMKKVRPFPLGLYWSALDPEWFPEKEFDIFYIGDNPKSTVRVRGHELLKKLMAMGYKVDLPTERISPDEFAKRCQRAWLVWSPEGSGWECGRHYETLSYGSIPIINYPTIERYKPLVHGEHCFYYGVEESDLIRVVEKALSDKEECKRIVRRGREHLNNHYRPGSITDYALNELASIRTEAPRRPLAPV